MLQFGPADGIRNACLTAAATSAFDERCTLVVFVERAGGGSEPALQVACAVPALLPAAEATHTAGAPKLKVRLLNGAVSSWYDDDKEKQRTTKEHKWMAESLRRALPPQGDAAGAAAGADVTHLLAFSSPQFQPRWPAARMNVYDVHDQRGSPRGPFVIKQLTGWVSLVLRLPPTPAASARGVVGFMRVAMAHEEKVGFMPAEDGIDSGFTGAVAVPNDVTDHTAAALPRLMESLHWRAVRVKSPVAHRRCVPPGTRP